MKNDHTPRTGELWIQFKTRTYWSAATTFTAGGDNFQRWASDHGFNADVLDHVKGYGRDIHWTFFHPFESVEDAVDAIQGARRMWPNLPPMAVRRKNVKWEWYEDSPPVPATGTTIPQEENMEQALHIPREALIAKLQENLDAETAKRKEAEDRRTENRKKVLDAIKSFSDDELVNIFSRNVCNASDAFSFVQWVERMKEGGEYKSVETYPSPTEDSLAKYVRVLEIATDKEIEVKPTDPIYPLL